MRRRSYDSVGGRPTERLFGTTCHTARKNGSSAISSLFRAAPAVASRPSVELVASPSNRKSRNLFGRSPVFNAPLNQGPGTHRKWVGSAGITRLGAPACGSATTDPSATRAPTEGWSGRVGHRPKVAPHGVLVAVKRPHRWGFPCCLTSLLPCMPSPLPRWT